MNAVTRRAQAAKLIEATLGWWVANTPEWHEGEDEKGTAQSALMIYSLNNGVSFGDVTFLIAVGALTMTDGDWRAMTNPAEHLKDAAAFLFEANHA